MIPGIRTLLALVILALTGAPPVAAQGADLERLRCAVLGFCPAPPEPTHTTALLYIATCVVVAGVVAGKWRRNRVKGER